jgi:uncharacterized RDD family membrane protein YckC
VRTPAFLFDQFVVGVVVVGPALALGTAPRALVTPGRTRTVVFLALLAVAFVYHFAFEWRDGRTPGKRLLGLRVVSDDGGPVDDRASFLRNALRLVDGLGYWTVAVLVLAYRGDGRRVGDVAGGTLVVRER